MAKIYRESFRFFFASLPVLLVFAAVIEGLFWVLKPRSETASTFVALTIIAYYFHRHFLFGEMLALRNQKPAVGVPAFKFGWFTLVSAGLVFVPIGVSLIVTLGYLDQPSPGAMILIMMPLYLIALSLFGTALPATVARDNTYRVTQGLRATLSTMWRLILGPGVVGLLILVATILAGKALEALGVTEDSLLTLGYFVLIRTLGFLTTILAVAVLCEMYRKTRPPPHHGQKAGMESQTPA